MSYLCFVTYYHVYVFLDKAILNSHKLLQICFLRIISVLILLQISIKNKITYYFNWCMLAVRKYYNYYFLTMIIWLKWGCQDILHLFKKCIFMSLQPLHAWISFHEAQVSISKATEKQAKAHTKCLSVFCDMCF